MTTMHPVRAQILADQAQRAEGETHTATTVQNAATVWGAPTRYTRVSAADQRRMFGGAPFGRRQWMHDARQGGFWVYRRVDYGRDWHEAWWSYEDLAQLLNRGRTVAGWKD